MKNPWTTVSSELKYSNPWISVREDAVIRPDGSPGIYGVVETRVATGAVALTDDNQVYLVGQYRYPTKMYSWEIIEGGAEIGETPIEAIKRELVEEAGLSAANWQQLGPEFHLSNCISNEQAVIFIARELTSGQARPEGTEILQVKKVPFSQALAMVHSGEIVDAMSIVGILRAEHLLKSEPRR